MSSVTLISNASAFAVTILGSHINVNDRTLNNVTSGMPTSHLPLVETFDKNGLELNNLSTVCELCFSFFVRPMIDKGVLVRPCLSTLSFSSIEITSNTCKYNVHIQAHTVKW